MFGNIAFSFLHGSKRACRNTAPVLDLCLVISLVMAAYHGDVGYEKIKRTCRKTTPSRRTATSGGSGGGVNTDRTDCWPRELDDTTDPVDAPSDGHQHHWACKAPQRSHGATMSSPPKLRAWSKTVMQQEVYPWRTEVMPFVTATVEGRSVARAKAMQK